MNRKPTREELEKKIKEPEKQVLMRNQAEDEANAQREILARVFETAPHIMMLVDKDVRITHINDRGLAFTGRRKDQSLGFLCGEVFSCLNSFDGPGCGRNAPCLNCAVRSKIMCTFETGQSIFDVESRLMLRRGSTDVPVDVLISTALVEDCGANKVLVTINDITERKRAQAELFNSRQMLRSILDNIPQRVFWKDRNSVYLGCNKAFALDCGFEDPSDLVGKSDYEATSAETADLYRADDREVMESGRPKLNYEEPLIRADGSQGWLITSKVPMFDQDGHVSGVMGTFEDITERKLVEIALRESEERFSKFFRASPVGTSITRLSDGQFLDVNDAFLGLFGYTREEVVGHSALELGIWANPEDRTKFVEVIQEQGRIKEFETQIRTKAGETRHVSVSAEEVEMAGESYILSLTFDITERKRAAEALSLRESYLRAILENLPGLVWLKDKEGLFLAVNQAFARSCSLEGPEDLFGKTDLDIWARELAEKYINEDKAVMTTGAPFVVEEIINVRGEAKWFETFKTPVVDNDGQILGTTGYARDITERKLLEEALKKANEGLESKIAERTKELKAKTRRYEELNTALKVLLNQREEYKTELEESILLNVKGLIVPYIARLKKSRLSGDQLNYLTLIESHILEITSPFSKRISGKDFYLTPVEVQTAGLIKDGKTTKEIAELMNVSENTVSSNRFHIRKKLGLTNKKINLRYYLKYLDK